MRLQEIDLIEEIARIHGYNNIPDVMPLTRMCASVDSEQHTPREKFEAALVNQGYQEAISYSFVDPKLQRLLFPDEQALELSNPIAPELAEMRVSLWPSLLPLAQYNLNRQQTRIRLFEIGPRFYYKDNELQQDLTVAGIAVGAVYPEQWDLSEQAVTFHHIKNDVQALLDSSQHDFEFKSCDHPCLHPGQAAQIICEERVIGFCGMLHPQWQQKLDLAQAVALFELDLAQLAKTNKPRYQAISKFPEIRRDLSLLVDEAVSAGEIKQTVMAAAGEHLIDYRLFDLYRGQGVPSGKKSIALGLILQHSSRTLTDQDVEAIVAKVIEKLQKSHAAELR